VTDPLLELLSANKELPFAPNWATEAGREYAQLVSAVDIDGITIEGARFGAKAQLYCPDQCVSFRLDMFVLGVTKSYSPLLRFDWLPLSPHNNRGRGPTHLKFVPFDSSHIHPYDWNWVDGKPLKGNMPIAIPVDDVLPTYQSALVFVEKLFKIKGVLGLSVPPWTSRLV
jgi:hypothetical protein